MVAVAFAQTGWKRLEYANFTSCNVTGADNVTQTAAFSRELTLVLNNDADIWLILPPNGIVKVVLALSTGTGKRPNVFDMVQFN